MIYEQVGNNTIYYTYDENGQIIGMNYNGARYYYIKNAQNDIVGILDRNLNQIVRYEYGSWGKITSIKDANGNEITSSTHIGKINPYRYRSYRYDEETGLYYLNSRYYNPEWGKFINADGIIGANMDMLGNNLYAYGSNNPVNGYDPTGQWFIKAITSSVNVVKELCGFEYTQAITKSKSQKVNLNSSILKAEIGGEASKYVVKKENSDKPITGYVKNNNNKIVDSSIGVKINIAKSSLTLNVSLKDVSLNYGIESKNNVVNSTEFGIEPIDWANIYFSVKSEATSEKGETSSYVKSSMSPLIPITAYIAIRAPAALLQVAPGYGLHQTFTY